ncbi:MAG: hypothetical protein ACREBE_01745, partial [bacterium]
MLSVAADADRRTFERILAAAPVEKDPELREDRHRALMQVSDAGRLRAVLDLIWDPRLDRDEAYGLLFSGRMFAQRAVVAAYLREHVKQML